MRRRRARLGWSSAEPRASASGPSDAATPLPDGRGWAGPGGAIRHGLHGIDVAGPSARYALRGWLGRRAQRPATARAVRDPPRRRGRGRLRRDRGAARPDGAGRLPAAPRQRPRRRGRLPGRLPRPGRQGRVVARARPAGQLALRRRRCARPAGPGLGSTAAARSRNEAPAAARRHVPPCKPNRCSTASRPRRCTARSTACRSPSAGRSCCATSRGSRPMRRRGGCDGPAGRSAAGWSGRAISSAAAWPCAASLCRRPRWPPH